MKMRSMMFVCLVCSKAEVVMKTQLASKGKRLQYIIVDLSPVTDIDASAVHFLMVCFKTCCCCLSLSVLVAWGWPSMPQ